MSNLYFTIASEQSKVRWAFFVGRSLYYGSRIMANGEGGLGLDLNEVY